MYSGSCNVSSILFPFIFITSKYFIETLIRLVLALGIPFNEIFGRKATGLEFTSKPQKVTARDDEVLRNTLLKMGCDKDDVKDILEFIDYKKYRKVVQSKMPKSRVDKDI